MIITPKTYYAYNRTCMEKFDSCIAFSRLSAAKIFAAKKQIGLKDWLEIYVTYNYKDCSLMYGKNVYFKKDGDTVMQYKVLRGPMLVIQRFNDSSVYPTKVMTRNNFINFMHFMKGCGYKVEIEQYPDNRHVL